MDYLLFTYPNCNKCDAMKKKLAETATPYQEFGLTSPPGKAKIRGVEINGRTWSEFDAEHERIQLPQTGEALDVKVRY